MYKSYKKPLVDYLGKKSSEKEKASGVAGSAGVNRPYSFISRARCTSVSRAYERALTAFRPYMETSHALSKCHQFLRGKQCGANAWIRIPP